jgi:hypothetical protein
VAEPGGTNLEESAVIDRAVKAQSQAATARLNIPARIYQVYGRQQLTIEARTIASGFQLRIATPGLTASCH